MSKFKVLLAERDSLRLLRPGDMFFKLDSVGEVYFSGLVLKALNHAEYDSTFYFLVLHRRICQAHENTIQPVLINYDRSKIEILSGDVNE